MSSCFKNLLEPAGGWINEVFKRTDTAGTSNLLGDALGSTVALTDGSGNLSNQYTYEPFGNASVTGSVFNPYQYTGRENDGTGLLFYRARYYNSQLGRFISEDPIEFSGRDLNLFGYVGNSPTNFKDPFGLLKVDPRFPQSCLPNLDAAIHVVRRAADKSPQCNCQFRRKMRGKRTLTQLLDSPDITIHYDPVQGYGDPEEGGGIEVGHTLPGDTHNIWFDPYGCRMGRWTLASALVHELAHITLVPDLGQEDVARQAQVTCGFRLSVTGTTVTVTP